MKKTLGSIYSIPGLEMGVEDLMQEAVQVLPHVGKDRVGK